MRLLIPAFAALLLLIATSALAASPNSDGADRVMRFDGNDYLTIPSQDCMSYRFWVEVRFKRDATSHVGTLISKAFGEDDADTFSLYFDADDPKLKARIGSVALSGGAITPDRWHTAQLIFFDGGDQTTRQVRLLLDQVEVARQTMLVSQFVEDDSPFLIGADDTDGDGDGERNLRGSMDYFWIADSFVCLKDAKGLGGTSALETRFELDGDTKPRGGNRSILEEAEAFGSPKYEEDGDREHYSVGLISSPPSRTEWENGTQIGPFDPVLARWSEFTGLVLNANGSANAFGFWTSPAIEVPPGQDITVIWRVSSTASNVRTPSIRLRINETTSQQGTTLVLESTGEYPLSTDFQGYGTRSDEILMRYTVPPYANAIRLSLDLMSFLEENDLHADVSVSEVHVISPGSQLAKN